MVGSSAIVSSRGLVVAVSRGEGGACNARSALNLLSQYCGVLVILCPTPRSSL